MNKLNSKESVTVENKYRDKLETAVKSRYLEKLKLIGGVDPYDLKKLSSDVTTLPSLTYPDIVNYLVFTPSVYTLDDLKNYKSLEAVNQVECGWVSGVSSSIINDKHLVKGRVLHSQRMREKALTPWLIAEKDGKILASHCDCMAGCGETCTHVAALMFWAMRTVKVRDERTVTQELAYWTLPPTMKNVQYREASQIDFTSSRTLKRKFDQKMNMPTAKSANTKSVRKSRNIPAPSESELDTLYTDLVKTSRKPAILSIVPDYLNAYLPKVSSMKLPKTLTQLNNKDAILMDHKQLLKTCESVEISITDEEVVNVERLTRKQSNEKRWYDFRAGRITASNMKAACSTNIRNPSSSLIKAIVYPKKSFKCTATQWGIDNEQTAMNIFSEALGTNHENVELKETGFFISQDKPFIGASPDGMVRCDCCGLSCVEVKCPYSRKGQIIDENVPYLNKGDDGELYLDRKHAYYFQIQTQLGVTKLESCYFVVWSDISVHIEQVMFDNDFWEEISSKAEILFRQAVLLELVGKFYTRLPGTFNSVESKPLAEITNCAESKDEDNETYCYCKGKEEPPMVGCDGENCKIVWFHFKCVNLTKKPEEVEKIAWLCPDCS